MGSATASLWPIEPDRSDQLVLRAASLTGTGRVRFAAVEDFRILNSAIGTSQVLRK